MRTAAAHRSRVLIWCLLIILVLGTATVLTARTMSKPRISPTAEFMQTHMLNPNGTITSYLKDESSTDPNIVAGHEALSESVGLWMQYTLLQHDQVSFDNEYMLLNKYFLSPEHYVWWKLDKNGTSHVNTNALGDDLRIVGSLLDAYERWNKPEYLNTAKQIVNTLWEHDQKNGYLVDYHDFLHNISSDQLSLTYIDAAAFSRMQKYNLISQQEYNRYMKLLKNIPNDGLFYPRILNVTTGQYGYDQEVNLIDQLIIAVHLTAEGQSSKQLVSFLKEQFAQDGRLYGRYHADNHQPAVAYESPAVYGLAILVALQTNDKEWANQLYERMITFRADTGEYTGGYVSEGDTHTFDNLLALLAETTLQQKR